MTLLQLVGRLILFSIFVFDIACAQEPARQQRRERLAIRAARMLDVSRGQLIDGAVVIIEGDKIVAAGQSLPIAPGTRVIDLGDCTLLPGLIDAHTHITYHFDSTGHFGLVADTSPAETLRYSAENARLTVNAGFTTIRNLGAGDQVDLRLRDAVRRGEIKGPRMIVSGAPLTPYVVRGADTTAQARLARLRQFVGERVSEGADVIKVFEAVDEQDRPFFSAAEIRAVVETAARAGLKVAVHAHEASAIKAAVEGGCASIEHGTFLDDEAIRLMVEHRTVLLPTVYLPTHYLENKSRFPFDASTWEFFQKLKSHNLDNLRKARKAGVQIVAGSDAVAGLHGQNARELVWFVKAGMSPAEAIRAATLDAARLLGMEGQIGELKAGNFADIIAVPGDPSRDITRLERVSFVMKAGEVIRDR